MPISAPAPSTLVRAFDSDLNLSMYSALASLRSTFVCQHCAHQLLTGTFRVPARRRQHGTIVASTAGSGSGVAVWNFMLLAPGPQKMSVPHVARVRFV